MITINFALTNPWSNRFDDVYTRWGKLPLKNKHWEFQVSRTNYVIETFLNITTKTDHAGLVLELSLFGYTVNFTVYDNRHWDKKTDNWEM